MRIKVKVIERDNYIIEIDKTKKRLIAHKDAVANIIEQLIYDNVIEEIEITIKNCEDCELETLDIIFG